MTTQESLPLSPAAAQYKRTFGCTIWTAVTLETLDARDPVDGLRDVEALWASVHEYEQSKAWSRASRLVADPATSYWLSTRLREVMVNIVPEHLPAITELLRICRLRVQRALAGLTFAPAGPGGCAQCDL